jgi:hypothetical protein
LGLRVRCSLFLYEFNQIWSFSTGFLTNAHTKFGRPLGAALITCGRTDRWKDGLDEDSRLRDYENTTEMVRVFLSTWITIGFSTREFLHGFGESAGQSVSQSVVCVWKILIFRHLKRSFALYQCEDVHVITVSKLTKPASLFGVASARTGGEIFYSSELWNNCSIECILYTKWMRYGEVTSCFLHVYLVQNWMDFG